VRQSYFDEDDVVLMAFVFAISRKPQGEIIFL
jgi:hypothetical protein